MQTASHLNSRNDLLSVDTIVALQLLQVFRDSDQDIDRVVEFIGQHPALVEETLKRSNSLRFRGTEYVTDIFEAVSRLGFYELYNIVSDSLTAQGINPEALPPASEELEWDSIENFK